MTAAYSAFAKAGPRIVPEPTPTRRLPRPVALLAVLLAAVMALLAAAASANAAPPSPETPVAGSVVIAVGMWDGTALLPIGNAVVPPLACDPVAR